MLFRTNPLNEFYEYRELLLNLVAKEYKAKYKGTVFGFLWSLVVPLIMVGVYWFAFGYLMRAPIEDFPVYLLSGLLPWTFFSGSLMGAVSSISANASLIKKIYFPREILPISTVLFNLVHFLLSFVILFPALAIFGRPIRLELYLLLPLVLIVHLALTCGVALLVAAWNVFFRDVQHLLEVLLMAWFFMTPIIYAYDQVSGALRGPLLLLYNLNPMVGVVELYHAILYGARFPSPMSVAQSIGSAAVWLVVGLVAFKRVEPRFAEEI
ncbi:ABC transporter permease [Candidatus Fermentibacteria bacterium]|nr:ABC transporter permease [Candidatus Fermentibacteria bacterium]